MQYKLEKGMIAKRRLLGLAIMGISIVAGIGTGALAFNRFISTDDAIAVLRWCVFVAFAGFVMHMFAVVQQLKEKKQRENNNKHESVVSG
jgi:hypothetical protein